MTKIAKILTKTMKENNLTQKEFCKSVGVTPSMMTQWLNGTSCVSIKSALSIEKIYGIDASKLNYYVRLSREQDRERKEMAIKSRGKK